MGAFSKVARDFKVRATVQMTLPLSLVALRAGAIRLAEPSVMEGLLRTAISETLLQAYRRRFLAALPGMINMQSDVRAERPDVRVPLQTRTTLLKAYRLLDAAKGTGKAQSIAHAQVAVSEARRAMHEALRQRERSRQGKLGGRIRTGRFRGLAMRVLELTAGGNEMRGLTVAGGAGVGVGSVASLNQILTPSATPELTGHQTSSTRQILWRQLEFGSGAFSTDKSAQGARHRLPSGGWWYGKSPTESLHLRGTRPGAVLRNPATQLPYDADSLRFRTVLGQFLTAALAA